MDSIDEWIEDYLERHQLSAKQLAITVNCDQSFITRLRNGSRHMSKDTVQEWNDKLHLTEDERIGLMEASRALLPGYAPIKKHHLETLAVTARNLQLMGRTLDHMVGNVPANGCVATEMIVDTIEVGY